MNEHGAAGTAGYAGLVRSSGPVVGLPELRQRRQHRDLVRAVPPVPRAVQWQLQQHLRHRPDDAAVRGLCVRLRLPFGAAARRRAAHLPVRPLAVERHGGPHRRHRRRGLLRRAMGDHPASARHHDWRRDHREYRLDHRAADRDRGMLLLVCGADHALPLQRDRELDLGRGVLPGRDCAVPAAARSSMARCAGPSSWRSSASPPSSPS